MMKDKGNVMTKEDVLAVIEKENIEYIRIEFLDYNGVIRSRTIHRDNIESALTTGVNFSTAIMSFTMFERYVENPTYRTEGGDFFALPDPASFAILPHRKNTARMYCDLVDVDGNPWIGCPRGMLKKLLKQAEEVLGGKLFMVFEQEAYLLKESEGKLVPADNSVCFSTEGLDYQEEFMQTFIKTMNQMGIQIEQISSEFGPGQIEINLKYDECIKATDNQVTFKQTFKQIARDLGMVGTLAPKPFSHLAGSGLHIHMSLYDETGRNLFKDTNDSYGLDLSKEAYYFIGGVLKHGRALSAIGAPSMNSYKRMVLGSFAPTHVCYGMGNRSTLVRVVETRRERRFEYRGADGTCNPYLLAAGLIAAGLEGVNKKINPGEPLFEDVGELSEEQLKVKNIEWLPRNLLEAIQALEENNTLAESLGRPIWTEFIKIKRDEWKENFYRIDEWERNTYSNNY